MLISAVYSFHPAGRGTADAGMPMPLCAAQAVIILAASQAAIAYLALYLGAAYLTIVHGKTFSRLGSRMGRMHAGIWIWILLAEVALPLGVYYAGGNQGLGHFERGGMWVPGNKTADALNHTLGQLPFIPSGPFCSIANPWILLASFYLLPFLLAFAMIFCAAAIIFRIRAVINHGYLGRNLGRHRIQQGMYIKISIVAALYALCIIGASAFRLINAVFHNHRTEVNSFVVYFFLSFLAFAEMVVVNMTQQARQTWRWVCCLCCGRRRGSSGNDPGHLTEEFIRNSTDQQWRSAGYGGMNATTASPPPPSSTSRSGDSYDRVGDGRTYIVSGVL
eukprot:g4205.t1